MPAAALVASVVDTFGRLDILINMASVYVAAAVRRAHGRRLGRASRRRSARRVPLRARRGAAHARAGRRPHHQLQRLGRAQRPAALPRLPAVLRREGRRDRADRGARARARRRQHPRQRDRAGPDPRAAGNDRRGIAARSSSATPLGRWGGEMEIAKAVLAFLDSDFITGETIRVDGGRHVKTHDRAAS